MPSKTTRPRKMSSGLLALKQIVEGTSTYTDLEFFESLVKNLAQVLDVHGVWVTEYLQEDEKLRSLAFWLDNQMQDEYLYDIANTPCESVICNDALFHVPERAIELFPDVPDLEPLNAVSYMGLALKDDNNKVLGHLALLDDKPMEEIPEALAIFKIFAARAEAELKRFQSQKKLKENEAKLNRLVNGTMDALIELNGDLMVTQCNQAALRAFELDSDAIIGTEIKKFFHPSGLRKVTQSIEHLDPKKDIVNSTWIQGYLECLTANGNTFHAEATLSSYNTEGQSYYALFFRNVEDRLQSEQEFKMLKVEAALLREKICQIVQLIGGARLEVGQIAVQKGNQGVRIDDGAQIGGDHQMNDRANQMPFIVNKVLGHKSPQAPPFLASHHNFRYENTPRS